jgi:hypothetical protein
LSTSKGTRLSSVSASGATGEATLEVAIRVQNEKSVYVDRYLLVCETNIQRMKSEGKKIGRKDNFWPQKF